MILQGEITINGKKYGKGSYISPWKVYPFFLLHMGIFGAFGFMMAYFSGNTPVLFMYMHGGIAIAVYIVFYITIFGLEEVKWMSINSGLGIFGLYSEIDILMWLAGKEISSFPIYVHVIPFMYYVLYTFLLRQAIIDLTGSREDHEKKEKVSHAYLMFSLILYSILYLF